MVNISCQAGINCFNKFLFYLVFFHVCVTSVIIFGSFFLIVAEVGSNVVDSYLLGYFLLQPRYFICLHIYLFRIKILSETSLKQQRKQKSRYRRREFNLCKMHVFECCFVVQANYNVSNVSKCDPVELVHAIKRIVPSKHMKIKDKG